MVGVTTLSSVGRVHDVLDVVERHSSSSVGKQERRSKMKRCQDSLFSLCRSPREARISDAGQDAARLRTSSWPLFGLYDSWWKHGCPKLSGR